MSSAVSTKLEVSRSTTFLFPERLRDGQTDGRTDGVQHLMRLPSGGTHNRQQQT